MCPDRDGRIFEVIRICWPSSLWVVFEALHTLWVSGFIVFEVAIHVCASIPDGPHAIRAGTFIPIDPSAPPHLCDGTSADRDLRMAGLRPLVLPVCVHPHFDDGDSDVWRSGSGRSRIPYGPHLPSHFWR